MTARRRPTGGWRRRLVAVATLAVLSTDLALAQSTTAPVLKAAFLFSFVKFTEWPRTALPPGRQLSLCVVGDTAVADALQQTIEGHTVDGRQLTVRILEPDGSPESCNLLYVSASEVARSGSLLASAKAGPIFTVSDAERFAESGGVAQLVREGDRMRFTVNLGAARRARLTLSSRLLSLAKVLAE